MNNNQGKNLPNRINQRVDNPSSNNYVFSNNMPTLNTNNINYNMYNSYTGTNNNCVNYGNQNINGSFNPRIPPNQNLINNSFSQNIVNNQYNTIQTGANSNKNNFNDLSSKPFIGGLKTNNTDNEIILNNSRFSLQNMNMNNNIRQMNIPSNDINYNNNGDQNNNMIRKSFSVYNKQNSNNSNIRTNTSSNQISENPFNKSEQKDENKEDSNELTVFNNEMNNSNPLIIKRQTSNENSLIQNLNNQVVNYLDLIEKYLQNGKQLNENEKNYLKITYPLLYEKVFSFTGNVKKQNSIPNINRNFNQAHQILAKQQYQKEVIKNSNLNSNLKVKPENLNKFNQLICKKKDEDPEYKSLESHELFETIKKNANYGIISVLGHGGFSIVFEAMSLIDGNIYAIKIIDKSKQPPKYIKREVKANQILKDVKFVLKFYQFIDLNTNYGLFALEKVDSNLQDFVMKSEPLTEQQVWFFFSQIIEGLIKIHSSGYVHRDLKPENILLNSYEVRIADFTTSKFIYEAEAEDTRLGTHGYISPEAGSKGIPNLYKYGYDIFSAGIIFFFLKFKEIPVIANLENCLDKKECTKEFKDLFNLLTLFDYSQRISVQSVKNDPWFINNNSSFYLSTKDNTPGRYNEINYKKISDKV